MYASQTLTQYIYFMAEELLDPQHTDTVDREKNTQTTQTDRQTDRQTHRQTQTTDRLKPQTDRQTDRQIDRHIYVHI